MANINDPEFDVLLERWQRDRDERARDELFAKFERWFHWAASRYAPRYNIDHDDGVQVARLAFLRALDKYDPQHGIRLTSYAESWVRGMMARHRLELNVVHVPAGAIDDGPKVARTVAKLRAEGVPISDENIAAKLGWTAGRAAHAGMRTSVSLDAPMSDEDGARTFVEKFAADDSWQPDTAVDAQEDARRIRDAVEVAAADLNERNADIFRRRFFEEQTLEEIGQHHDLTRERVRQLLSEEIIPHMRKALTGDPRITDIVPDREIEEERRREDAWFKCFRGERSSKSVLAAPYLDS